MSAPRSFRRPINRDAFFALAERTGACLIWTGSRSSPSWTHAYGIVTVDGRQVRAHRVSYEIAVGRIVPGNVIDHTCLDRLCVEPSHLDQITANENSRRGPAYNRPRHP